MAPNIYQKCLIEHVSENLFLVTYVLKHEYKDCVTAHLNSNAHKKPTSVSLVYEALLLVRKMKTTYLNRAKSKQ